MSYGKSILGRVEASKRLVKAKYTLYFTTAVYDEFRRKCGENPPSTVLEAMMRDFNESAPEPKTKSNQHTRGISRAF